ncbi:MAG: DUF6788 family protein [Syntrophobacteraceae bacterium]|jgi:hypothetical protein
MPPSGNPIFGAHDVIFIELYMDSIYTVHMTRPTLTSESIKHVLAQIRKIKPFIQASLSIYQKRCGNPKCRCAREGPIHETAQLTWKEGGRTRSLHVPAELRQEVAEWVEEGKLLKSLIGQMSTAQRELLISKRKSNK